MEPDMEILSLGSVPKKRMKCPDARRLKVQTATAAKRGFYNTFTLRF